MNTFQFVCYGIRMLYFFLIYSKATSIENRVQIQAILCPLSQWDHRNFFYVINKYTFKYTNTLTQTHTYIANTMICLGYTIVVIWWYLVITSLTQQHIYTYTCIQTYIQTYNTNMYTNIYRIFILKVEV